MAKQAASTLPLPASVTSKHCQSSPSHANLAMPPYHTLPSTKTSEHQATTSQAPTLEEEDAAPLLTLVIGYHQDPGSGPLTSLVFHS